MKGVNPLVEYSYDPDDYDRRDIYEERRDIDLERMRDEAMRDMQRDRDRTQEDIERMELERGRRALEEVIDNPTVSIDNSMVRAVNDPRISGRDVIRRSGQFSRSSLLFGIGLGLGDKDKKKKRKKSKMDSKMSKALKQANAQMRKKNGQLRKGKTMKDVMRRAHRLAKKL